MNIKKTLFYFITVLFISELKRIISLKYYTNIFNNLYDVDTPSGGIDSTLHNLAKNSADFFAFSWQTLVLYLILPLLFNFGLLWILNKITKRNKFTFLITSVATLILLLALVRGFSLDFFRNWYFVSVIGIFLSVLLINFIVTRSLPVIKDAIFMFVSLISYFFASHFLSSLLDMLGIKEYYYKSNIINFLIFIIIFVVSAGYLIFIWQKNKQQKLLANKNT